MKLFAGAAPSAPSTARPRVRWTAVLLLPLMLTGCGQDGSGQAPPGPQQTRTSTSSPGEDPQTTATPAPDGQWGAYPSQETACTAVADDVFSLAQLPPSLELSDGSGGFGDVRSRLDLAETKGPPELREHYAELRRALQAYNATPTEPSASAAPSNSTVPATAPSPTATREPSEQLSQEVEQLLEHLRAWLGRNCR